MQKTMVFLMICLLLLTGCSEGRETEKKVSTVLVEAEGVISDVPEQTVSMGETVSFLLQEEPGYTVTGCSVSGAELRRTDRGVQLTFPALYTQRIRLTVQKSNLCVRYDGNGGITKDSEESAEVWITGDHLRHNTALQLFERSGYIQIGWSRDPEGRSGLIGMGSRTEMTPEMVLYAIWRPCTEASLFSFVSEGEELSITGYSGEGDELVIPASINGFPVRSIRTGSFSGCSARRVILPPGLREVEDGAFTGAAVEELWIHDDLARCSDYAFDGCPICTLHVNAVLAPVYSTGYYATFADKMDRLMQLRDNRKIVLFSGSSTRFGYDSAAIDKAFPAYDVVNMGVFAYTNALPQLDMIRGFMKEGDVLLHSPEFDAAQRQFCSTNRMDGPFMMMMEANYDLLTLLDLTKYTGTFTALHSFLVSRQGMPEKTYSMSPGDYDEEGNPVPKKSYNEYGDYVLYRPNSETDAPVYGLPVAYTRLAFPKDAFLRPLNQVYGEFQRKGITVLFTYAPRNRQAISPESSEEERSLLHRYFQEYLCVPVISSLEDSLVEGKWLSGTDNHLSTEGVAIRTEQIIEELRPYLMEAP